MQDKLGNSLGYVISQEDDTTSGYEHVFECFDILDGNDKGTDYMLCQIVIPHGKEVSPEFSYPKSIFQHNLIDIAQVINEIKRRENDDNEKKVCPICANSIFDIINKK